MKLTRGVQVDRQTNIHTGIVATKIFIPICAVVIVCLENSETRPCVCVCVCVRARVCDSSIIYCY